MIIFWLLVFVAYEGIKGGTRQTVSDARTGVRNVRRSARNRTAARFRMWDAAVRRHKPYSPVRIAWWSGKTGYKAGAYGIAATRATSRGVRRAHRSWRAGWSDGAQRGRERHAAYAAARDHRRMATREALRMESPMEPFPEHDSSRPDEPAVPVVTPHRTDDEPSSVERTQCATTPDDSDPSNRAGEPTPSAPQEGTPAMTIPNGGEALNIDQARQVLKEIYTKSTDFVSTVDTLQASLASAELDPQTLGDVADILEAAQTTQGAADKAVKGLDSRHAHMEEAVNSTPHVAKTEFYRH